MIKSGKSLAILMSFAALAASTPLAAQIDLPRTAVTAGKDSSEITEVARADMPLRLSADLSKRKLYVQRGDSMLRVFDVSVGRDRYPTPTGSYTIKKMIWNPSWRPPPESDWAKGKTAKGPGDPGNPMKVVKIFFREPDYYIHGTDAVESLGSAASHGCLRMDPEEVASLAKLIMEHGGAPRDENWFWRVLHSRREEKVVYLDNPVELTIAD
jgi:lipoprotein-anchoring transpeptidase ErfK/SrfK